MSLYVELLSPWRACAETKYSVPLDWKLLTCPKHILEVSGVGGKVDTPLGVFRVNPKGF